MWYVWYLEWNSSAAFWVKRLRFTKKHSENCKPKVNLQNIASPSLQNRRARFLSFCRGETITVYKRVQFLIHRSVLSLACCQQSIHQVTNTQWSTKHSTPTNCYKNDKTYGQLNSHALSPPIQVSAIYLLYAPRDTVRLNCKVLRSTSMNANPRKRCFTRAESRQIGGVIWTSRPFLINTGPFIPTFISG